MRKFRVELEATGTLYAWTIVEAETGEEAAKKVVDNWKTLAWNSTGYPSKGDIMTPVVDEI